MRRGRLTGTNNAGSSCSLHKLELPMQLPQLLHRFNSEGDADPILHARYKRQQKRSRPKETKKDKKKEKWGDDRRTRFWGDHWTPKPPFFGLSSPTPIFFLFFLLFFLYFPPWPNRDVKLSDSFGIFSDSRSLCAVFPSFDYCLNLNPCVSPDFRVSTLPFSPLYHYSGGVLLFAFFLSLYSQLGFTLYDLLVTFPYLFFTFLPFQLYWLLLKTTVCLSAWLPSS